MQRTRRQVAGCLVALLIALAAPKAQAQSSGRTSPGAAAKVSTLEMLKAAQTWIERGDGRKAVRLIEQALPGASATDRATCLETLRRAYPLAAQQADQAGQTQEADEYRTNLEILKRKAPVSAASAAAAAPVAEPASPSAVSEPVAPSPPASAEPRLPAPPAPLDRPEVIHQTDEDRRPPEPRPTAEEAAPSPIDLGTTTPEPPTVAGPATQTDLGPRDNAVQQSANRELELPAERPAQSPGQEPISDIAAISAPGEPAPAPPRDDSARIAEADEAFRDARYSEAGAIYAELYEAQRLPRLRFDALAYCRRHALVQRINEKPGDRAEWYAIRDEIIAIRKLTPNHWYDEYLLSLVSELMTKAGIDPGTSPAPATRESAPAASSRRSPISRYAQPANSDQSEAKPAARTEDPNPFDAYSAPTAVAEADAGNWKVLKTPNFLIYHDDPALARQVAARAEQARSDAWKFWAGPNRPLPSWTPPCYLYLFPDATLYVAVTGQPADSPGFSTTGVLGGRVTSRRINLRVGNPKMLSAVLPHEVTHVVLADLFGDTPIPRWADEGMAALSEPDSEQALRAGDLADQISSARLFEARDLLVMDYPDENQWPLYYAQSISLTRYLVERKGPPAFLTFLRDAQRNGYDVELARVYGFTGYADLQHRWSTQVSAAMIGADRRADAELPGETATR